MRLDERHSHNVEDAAGVCVFRVREFIIAPTFVIGRLDALVHLPAIWSFQIEPSPGSSGGPVFVADGSVIGLSVAEIEGGQNLNFAVPINNAKPLLAGGKPIALSEIYEPKPAPVADAHVNFDSEKFDRYLKAGMDKEARQLIDTAVKADEFNWALRYRYGLLLAKLDDDDDAAEQFRICVNLNPDWWEALQAAAEMYTPIRRYSVGKSMEHVKAYDAFEPSPRLSFQSPLAPRRLLN